LIPAPVGHKRIARGASQEEYPSPFEEAKKKFKKFIQLVQNTITNIQKGSDADLDGKFRSKLKELFRGIDGVFKNDPRSDDAKGKGKQVTGTYIQPVEGEKKGHEQPSEGGKDTHSPAAHSEGEEHEEEATTSVVFVVVEDE